MEIRERIEAKAAKVGVLVYWGLGDPALKPSRKARQARDRAANQYGMNWYAPIEGLPIAHEAIFSLYADEGIELRMNKNGLSPNIGITTLGTRSLLTYRLEALREELGRQPVAAGPWDLYGGHTAACKAAGAKYVPVRCNSGESFIEACARLLAAGEHYDLIIASAVYNPTGDTMSHSDRHLAVRMVRKYKVALMVDGAYKHLYYGQPIPSIFSIRGARKLDIFETISCSKAPQWPDLKSGAYIARPSLVKAITARMSLDIDGGSGTNQVALAACYNDRENLTKTRAYYKRMMAFVLQVLHNAGWTEVRPPKAGIFFWTRIPQRLLDAGWNSEDFALALADLGIIVFPDTMFNGDGTKVRICPKGSQKSIREAGKRITALLNGQFRFVA